MGTINRRSFLANISLATALFAAPNFVYPSIFRPDEYIITEPSEKTKEGILNNVASLSLLESD